jgi:prepilin-type N-terminal cleavage/methylation domain-containing protein
MKISLLQKGFTPTREQRNENMFSFRANAVGGKARRAFTLIEMMVAVSIFSVVMLIGVGSLLSLVQSNRRAQAINSVMNNVNASVESMTRTMRVGTGYRCETSINQPSSFAPQDCSGNSGQPPGKLLAFESASGDKLNPNDQVVYRLNDKQLERSLQSGANGSWVALTSPEVSIETFDFFVVGAPSGDGIQPRVLMRIKGSAEVPGGTTTFTVQSSVVQRLLDI